MTHGVACYIPAMYIVRIPLRTRRGNDRCDAAALASQQIRLGRRSRSLWASSIGRHDDVVPSVRPSVRPSPHRLCSNRRCERPAIFIHSLRRGRMLPPPSESCWLHRLNASACRPSLRNCRLRSIHTVFQKTSPCTFVIASPNVGCVR